MPFGGRCDGAVELSRYEPGNLLPVKTVRSVFVVLLSAFLLLIFKPSKLQMFFKKYQFTPGLNFLYLVHKILQT